MIKQFGGFEDIGEAAHEAGAAVAKTTQKQAQSFVKTAVGQVTGNQSANTSPNNQNGTNEQAAAGQKQMSDDQAKQFLKDLYGPSKPQDRSLPNNQSQNSNQVQPQDQNSNPVADALGLPQNDPNKGKSPQELAQIEGLRRELHADYYRTLTSGTKKQEESVTEKLEREDQEEQMKSIEDDKKKPQALPQTVKQGTGEKMVGVSG